ncbi:hypothetical protein AYO49_03000 [Verrucomicrobiaceae bacterium SCGC AG-212-N21]|nr:hypothetical protein AYO49_03000 [Verrucomicrobiaceae bacterium SCGC AG-212-N21]
MLLNRAASERTLPAPGENSRYMTSPSNSSQPSTDHSEDQAIVCFCARKTLGDLRAAYAKHGTLTAMQEATRAGLGCGGCRAILQHHFGETPIEVSDLSEDHHRGATLCVKPGNRIMKCFIGSSSLFESRAFSCNAVPLQLGSCDATTAIEYTIYNQAGKPILSRSEELGTSRTFLFDTERERLPRPFFGMIAYRLERQNYGASRLNVAWHSGDSVTSTHENFSTGRPDVVLPVPVDPGFLKGPNEIYLAVQNPHPWDREVVFRVFRLHTSALYDDLTLTPETAPSAVEFRRKVPAFGTQWIHASSEFYAPALEKIGKGPVALRIYAPGATVDQATSTYFFLHHRTENIWSANHL